MLATIGLDVTAAEGTGGLGQDPPQTDGAAAGCMTAPYWSNRRPSIARAPDPVLSSHVKVVNPRRWGEGRIQALEGSACSDRTVRGCCFSQGAMYSSAGATSDSCRECPDL